MCCQIININTQNIRLWRHSSLQETNCTAAYVIPKWPIMCQVGRKTLLTHPYVTKPVFKNGGKRTTAMEVQKCTQQSY